MKIDISKLDSRYVEVAVQVGVTEGMTEVASKLADAIRQEIPKKTGEMAASVSVIPPKRYGSKIHAGVIIDHPGAMEVWKGGSRNIFGNMAFTDWPDGPPELRNPKTGKFHFRKVSHFVEPNNFIERALEKIKPTASKSIFSRVQKFFSRGRRK